MTETKRITLGHWLQAQKVEQPSEGRAEPPGDVYLSGTAKRSKVGILLTIGDLEALMKLAKEE